MTMAAWAPYMKVRPCGVMVMNGKAGCLNGKAQCQRLCVSLYVIVERSIPVSEQNQKGCKV